MYDAIVVGAGPGGSTAANNLAKNGASVLLLDKAKFPRHKACGGGLTPHIWKRHPEILDYIENYNYAGNIFVEGDPNPIYYETPEIVGAYCVRDKFDHMLVQNAIKAGAKFLENEKVKNVIIKTDSVVVETEAQSFTGRVVLGADGVNSVVAAKTGLNPAWPENATSFCLEVEEEFPEEVITKYFTDKRMTYWHAGFLNTPGYGYIFPKKHHINIGFGCLTPEKLPYKDILLKYIDYCESHSYVPKFKEKRVVGAQYPICGPLKNFVGDRVLLLGDAAGFVNPLNGEGIHYAIYSGDIAAETLQEAFKANDLSQQFLSRYSKRCMKAFGNYLKTCVGMQYNHLGGSKLVAKYGRQSRNVLKGLTDIFNEQFNPKWISLRTGMYLALEIIKKKFRRNHSEDKTPVALQQK
jgi:geranylgeranyl reductase family protein